MKKLITSVLVIVLLLSCSVVIFAACDTTDYDRTIIFYSQQNDKLQAITATAIANFEAKYPGWKVRHDVISNGYNGIRTKVVQDLQGKKQPDLAYCYPDHVALYMQTEKVIDLKNLINSAETVKDANGNDVRIGFTTNEIANFVEAYYNEGLATNFTDYDRYGYEEDAMLVLPFVKSTELLFYNKTALDDAGLKPAKTWDELWQQAPILAQKYTKATVLGYDSEANWFITESERQGWGYTSVNKDKHYLFDNENVIQWLDDVIATNADKGYITTQQIYGNYTSNLFKMGVVDKKGSTNTDDWEQLGGAIYCVGSSGGATNQETNNFEWDVTTLPASVTANGQSDKCISQGPSLVMLNCDRAQNPDEKAKMTFLFMKELLSPQIQAAVSMEQGYAPSIKGVEAVVPAYAEFLAKADERNIKAMAVKLTKELADAGKLFTSPCFVGSSTARDQVGNALQYVIEQSKDGASAVKDALKNCGGNNSK